MSTKNSGKLLPSWYKLSGLFSLCFAVLFFLYSRQFTSFYTTPAPLPLSGSTLTVLFANIHKNNIEYTGLQDLILRADPDVVLFVEFADHHYEHLKSFLQSRYPYINSTTWSKQFIGSMVFSKQKIENWADNFPQGMRRYGYFSLTLRDQPYYFYLVHTSSPDSYAHFLMRNNQIASFDKDFAIHAQKRPLGSPVIVVGDFNTTPRSAYYADIEHVFSGTLTNMSKYIPFLRTWRLFELPFVQAHIDHIWANSGLVQ
jgi:endonuclease/exonuclease/phosphatase (EEP) superfamily protein YafD